MNKKIWQYRSFWVVLAILFLPVIGFRTYVWQMEKQGLHLQIGNSLSPVISDYFSWSKERPMVPNEMPVVGEFYTYMRPKPDYLKMNVWQKVTVWLHETASGGITATKQCHSVSEDGLMWDTATDDKLVPTSSIVAYVVEIYDSKYAMLSKTPEGQFQLWVERHHPNNTYVWDKSRQYLALYTSDGVQVYDKYARPLRSFPGWQLKMAAGSFFTVWRQNDKWSRTLVSYWPASGKVVSPCDEKGNPLPALNPVYIGRGYQVTGRLALVCQGGQWMVDPTGPHRQTSIVKFDKPFVGKLKISGGGEADILVRIAADGKEITSLYGNWPPQSLELKANRRLEIEISRGIENGWTSGGISKFALAS